MEPGEYDLIAALEDRHWWYAGMRASARALLRTVLVPGRGRRILDAGCGAGGGLRWLAEFGTVAGLDFHPRAVTLSRQVSPRVCRASVLAVPLAAATFDVVTTFDVLYHRAVLDDELALRELARVLRPGGWLLARVPAHDQLRGAHDAQVHTRHRYSRAELRAKVEAAGLRLERLTYAGLLLLPPALLRRGFQRRAAAAAEAHSDVALPAPPVNAALGALLAWERWWLPRWDLPAGLSLLVLAHKPQSTGDHS